MTYEWETWVHSAAHAHKLDDGEQKMSAVHKEIGRAMLGVEKNGNKFPNY